jgi:hypothetical protein
MISDLKPSYKYEDLDITFESDRRDGKIYPKDRIDGIAKIGCSNVISPDGKILDDENYAPDSIVLDLEVKRMIGIFRGEASFIADLSDENITLIRELMAKSGKDLCVLHERIQHGKEVPSSQWQVEAIVI